MGLRSDWAQEMSEVDLTVKREETLAKVQVRWWEVDLQRTSSLCALTERRDVASHRFDVSIWKPG